jgi:hypothetical protein
VRLGTERTIPQVMLATAGDVLAQFAELPVSANGSSRDTLQCCASKHRDRPYRCGRQKHWIKIKNRKHPAMERLMSGNLSGLRRSQIIDQSGK